MPRSSDYIINFQNVSHKFKQGKSIIKVLNSVNFQLKNNCIAALIGASGSGKSTFLHLPGQGPHHAGNAQPSKEPL